MKLKANKDTTTLAVGDLDAKAFGVDTSNGVIFDILRNKMYSNKIAAVAREISSNSRDANRENGKSDVPIEITIVAPNVLMNSTDTQILFKDAGVGITPDRMDNIFLKYGASSKRNTNKQTGGFGLGAKTPFAYTDTFTIITVCDYEGKRMKYIYTASITDRAGVGSGEMILFSAEETKEQTGTAIVVPIKDSDRYEFEKEIYRATTLWKVRPKYVGFENDAWKITTEYKGKGFSVVSSEGNSFGSGVKLVIDGIPYHFDTNQVSLGGDFLYSSGKLLCLDYKNGELTISANREAVQYDRQTKTRIAWKIRQVRNAFRDELNTKFSTCKTYLEACIFANSIDGFTENPKMKLWEHVAKWLRGVEFKFNGKVLAKEANFLHYDVFRYEKYDANGKLFGMEMSKRRYDDKWNLPLYLMTSGKRHTGKNATLVDAGGFILIVPAKIELKADGKDAAQKKHYQEVYDQALERQAEELKILQEYGVPINDYSTVVPKVLPKGQSDSTTYRKTNEVGVQVRTVTNSTYYANWHASTITFLRKEQATADGATRIYCTTDKLSNFAKYSQDNPELPPVATLQKGIVAAALLKYTFVCVPERDAHYFEEAGMLTVAEAWKLVLADQKLVDKMIEAKNFKATQSLQLEEGWLKLKLTGRVDATTESMVEMYKNKDKSKNELINIDLGNITEAKATVSTDGIKATLQKLYKKYPMLEFFISNYRDWSYRSGSRKEVNHMNKVMDVVDAYKVLSEEEEEAATAAAEELKRLEAIKKVKAETKAEEDSAA